MTNTLLAALVSVIFFAPMSIGYAQSAEDLVKNQSQGVVYSNTWVENGVRYLNRIIIRGDEITWLQTIGQETRIAGLGPEKVISTRREGNRLILETNRKQKYVIDGDVMQRGNTVFTRER